MYPIARNTVVPSTKIENLNLSNESKNLFEIPSKS